MKMCVGGHHQARPSQPAQIVKWRRFRRVRTGIRAWKRGESALRSGMEELQPRTGFRRRKVRVTGAADGFGGGDDGGGGVAAPWGWWRACGLLNAKAVCSRTSWRVWAQV